MKLGLGIPWDEARPRLPMERIQLAEQLGFDSVWTAEAYGSDAFTPLSFIAAQTQRLRLGTSVAQVAARPPTTAAMTAATLDALSGEGRVILGLGLSGPQVVEGWYGQPWGQPGKRLADYVQIVRKAWRRAEPLHHDGEELQLPYQGAGASGLGKPLRSILHANADLPIWLGTGAPRHVQLTAELADGWLPFGFVPGMMEHYRPALERGFAARHGRPENFEIQASCHVFCTEDVRAALEQQKVVYALYVGGMGHRQLNFHQQLMMRRGYAAEAERVQELFLGGHREEAAAAVPDEYVDDAALIGSPERLRERLLRWRDSGATGLILHGADERALRLLAEVVC